MSPFKFLISREEALKIVFDSTTPINKTELILIHETSTRILAETILADIDIPSFNRAAMDGYTVKKQGHPWRVPHQSKNFNTLRHPAYSYLVLEEGEEVPVNLFN